MKINITASPVQSPSDVLFSRETHLGPLELVILVLFLSSIVISIVTIVLSTRLVKYVETSISK